VSSTISTTATKTAISDSFFERRRAAVIAKQDGNNNSTVIDEIQTSIDAYMKLVAHTVLFIEGDTHQDAISFWHNCGNISFNYLLANINRLSFADFETTSAFLSITSSKSVRCCIRRENFLFCGILH